MENSSTAKKDWFLRSGMKMDSKMMITRNIPYFAKPFVVKNDNEASIQLAIPCSRCGGAGGADKWIFTGYTCYKCGGSGFMGYRPCKLYSAEKLEKLNINREKAQARAEAKRMEKQVAEQAAKDARKDEVKAINERRYPEAMAALGQYEGDMDFMNDIRQKAFGGEELTEKQASAVIKVQAKINDRNDWDSFVKSLEANKQPATTGRISLDGYVLAAKWHAAHDGYGRFVNTLKILFIDKRGFKVWVSAPKGLKESMVRDDDGVLELSSAKKLHIAFKATLEPKEGDAYFAFGKRPSKLN